MQDIINFVKGQSTMVIIIICTILFIIYSMFAVLLNKLNNVKYGKSTIFAWIPGINVILLGKLVVHWSIGVLLFFALLFGICISYPIPYLEKVYTSMPSEYVLIYQVVYILIIFILFIIGKVQLDKIIQTGTGKDAMSLFVSKKLSEKEPEFTIQSAPINTSHETINDNFHYNVVENKPEDNSNNQNP